MIVDMARNDLGRVSRPGSVSAPRLMYETHLPYAHHLVSDVEGALLPGTTLTELLTATAPAASISGTPKHRACRLIRRIEPSPRGPYTGTPGSVAPDGRFAFSVLTRTVWRHGHDDLHYGTGGGIVADSDGPSEYREALLKTEPIRGAAVPEEHP
jgi:anthranilate/para-aminobenzoate synthase component I